MLAAATRIGAAPGRIDGLVIAESNLVFRIGDVITLHSLSQVKIATGDGPKLTKGQDMDTAVFGTPPSTSSPIKSGARCRPSRSEAEAAVRTLIGWAGDDPDREGLTETPERVVRAYEEFFAGYGEDPEALLATTFEETAAYDEMIVLRDIRLESHCEHHMVPILGKAHIGYLPSGRVVGISKLARLVEVFTKRMQTQEALTSQIADTIQEVLKPRGVGVVIEAAHQCMTTRGIRKPGGSMVTSRLLGCFRDDPTTRRELLAMIGSPRSGSNGA